MGNIMCLPFARLSYEYISVLTHFILTAVMWEIFIFSWSNRHGDITVCLWSSFNSYTESGFELRQSGLVLTLELFCFCTKQASRAWKWTPLPSFSTRESHTQLIAGRSAIYSSFSFAWGQLWGAFYTSSFISPLDWTLVPTVVADLMIQPAFPSLSYLLLF